MLYSATLMYVGNYIFKKFSIQSHVTLKDFPVFKIVKKKVKGKIKRVKSLQKIRLLFKAIITETWLKSKVEKMLTGCQNS